MIRCSLLAIAAVATLPAYALAGGKFYKWVDEEGHVRYGDHIPAQYADKGNEQLNKQGLVVDTKEPAKTLEQRAEEQRLAELAAEEEREQKERLLHDRILVDTYSNEEEMITARAGKIEAIEANIRVTNGRIEKLRQNLVRLNQQAATIERSGKPVPESIQRQITESRAQIAHNLEYIESRELEQRAIQEKFETDIKRFRELKAAAAEQSP